MQKYYLERSASGKVGNCLLWWRKGGLGYTCDLNDAEIFPSTDPVFVSAMKSGKYTAWPKEHADSAATFHVDHQRLNLDEAVTTL